MHLEKNPPEIGMLIVKIGGPAYRIGMGGGAASSVASGSNKADLDFNAVQVLYSPLDGQLREVALRNPVNLQKADSQLSDVNAERRCRDGAEAVACRQSLR